MKMEVVFSWLARWSLITLVFLLPLMVLPITGNALEAPKQLVLMILVAVAFLARLALVARRKEWTWIGGGWMILPLLFLLATVVSGFFSIGGIQTWMGFGAGTFSSVLTTACLIGVFYLFAGLGNDPAVIRQIRLAFFVSTALVGAIGALGFFGVSAPAVFGQQVGFNTIGTVQALGVYLAVAMWMAQAELVFSRRMVSTTVLYWIVSAFALLTALAVDDPWLWILHAFGGVVVCVLAVLRKGGELRGLSVPLLTVVLAGIFFFAPVPFRLQTPVVVSPSFPTSWTVARSTLQTGTSALLFGSGPGTFGFDYAKFHPNSVNRTIFWDTPFDRARSFALTLLSEQGVVSLALWIASLLLVLVLIIADGRKHRFTGEQSPLIVGWALLILGHLFFASNVALLVALWMVSGLLVGAVAKRRVFSLAESAPKQLVVSFISMVLVVMVGVVLFTAGKSYVAEIFFQRAVVLNASSVSEADAVLVSVAQAMRLDPRTDAFARNVAVVLLARAKTIVTASAEPLSEANRQQVTTLVAEAINVAKRATELSPNNPDNWIVRGAIYRDLMPYVSGAEDFAAATLQRAVALEPNNPARYTDLGRVYLAVADYATTLVKSENPEVASKAKTALSEQLLLAEQAFQQAIDHKLDYAPAYYYLAATYERQGRLAEAIARLKPLITSRPNDLGLTYQLAMLALRQGDDVLARAGFERLLIISPNNVNALWYLAVLDEKAGDKASAKGRLEQIMALHPDDLAVRERLQAIIAGLSEPVEEIPEPVTEGEFIP